MNTMNIIGRMSSSESSNETTQDLKANCIRMRPAGSVLQHLGSNAESMDLRAPAT